MAILDSRLEFADEQTLSAAGASTNIIDLVDSPRHIGPGRPMYVMVHVASASEATEVTLQTAEAEGFGTPIDLATVNVPAGAENEIFVVGVPYRNEQFLRLNVDPGAGEIVYSAHLTDQEPFSWQAYPAPSQA